MKILGMWGAVGTPRCRVLVVGGGVGWEAPAEARVGVGVGGEVEGEGLEVEGERLEAEGDGLEGKLGDWK